MTDAYFKRKKTLGVRLDRPGKIHEIAKWLSGQKNVTKAYYAGLLIMKAKQHFKIAILQALEL